MNFISPRSFLTNATVGGWRGYMNIDGIYWGLITITTPFWLNVTAVKAQLLLTESNYPILAASEAKALYVNPALGNDQTGNGSERLPLKTITQALRLSQGNTLIVLTSGIYNAQNGEIFPLFLKPGITIQGNPRTRGQDIVIKGGGEFLSRTAAGQDVTIVGADQAGLTGVTITNTNERGYGLWIESSSPVVVENTFTGNNHDGISVNGNSAPLIRSNYFYNNSGNGITIYGTSHPEVRDNVFLSTGFGISITQNATPRIISNRISNNRDGVVVEGNAQPILRNNIISNNQRDGLVAISQSRPDLGTAADPGGNIFRGNGGFEIRNSVANQIIPAFGNQISNRTEGRIDLTGTISSLNTRYSQNNSNSQSMINPPAIVSIVAKPKVDSVTLSAASFPVPSSLIKPTSSITNNFASIPSINNTSQNTTIEFSSSQLSTQQIPVPPNLLNSSPLNKFPQNITTLPPVFPPSTPQTMPIINPNTVTQMGEVQQQPLNLLPVPSSHIPIGNIGNTIKRSTVHKNTPLSHSNRTKTTQGFRYRVVVITKNNTQENLVQSLIPDMFHSVYHGRKVLQVGAYSDRSYAQDILKLLQRKGIQGIIDQMY